MSSQQISTEGNGNIILGHQIPDEILLQIFLNINDDIIIKVISLVCQHWHELSRSWYLWRERLKKLNVKISNGRLEKFVSTYKDDSRVISAIQWLCINHDRKAVNHNLLKNPSGTENFNHWKIQHGGDKLIVEEYPLGCDPIPDEACLPTQHCFVSSFAQCKRSQSVSLYRDYGFKPFVLEVLQPSLVISEWVSARFDCGGRSMIQVTAMGTNNEPVVFIMQWKDSDYGKVKWHKVLNIARFDELPEGLHTIQFKNFSQDSQFWAGHYGPKTAGSSVVLDITKD